MSLYLLHFDPPYQHARHYLGFTANGITSRVAYHVAGHGSPLIREAVRAGSAVIVARTWREGDRTAERRLKRQGGLSRHCPLCRASGVYHR